MGNKIVFEMGSKSHRAKLLPMFCRYYCCYEKGNLLERVGLKAIGPVIMGDGITRQMDMLNTRVISFLEKMGFFYLSEV
jgi:hypothetical protein